ncbi:hypothetical protein L6164_033598 [Bauhinia variegata]|uniref:Uncharacterized protein n=1 Tax=Bauhinia variegata TaxID=167791 RepID=A0ACB9KSC6_BAUVA|nr:hypothetical protein L6164_033598 [Bauhinia variegata]
MGRTYDRGRFTAFSTSISFEDERSQNRIEIEFCFFCASKKSSAPISSPGIAPVVLPKHNNHLRIQRLIHFWELLALGINRHTLKTDIINLLEGCNLTLEDVKVNYSRGGYMPLEMLLELLQGRVACTSLKGLIEPNGISLLPMMGKLFYCKDFLEIAADPDVRMATVRFPSKIEAMNAFIQKNGAFCLNNPVSVRVLL